MTKTSRIMKSNDARDLARDAEFNFLDIRQKCEAFIEKTKEQVKELLGNAQQEIASDKQKAIQGGRTEGLKKGLEAAEIQIEQRASELANQRIQEQLSQAVPALQNAAEMLRQEQEHCLVRWEANAIQLATAIAEKLTRLQIQSQPEIVQERMAQILRLTVGETEIQLHLNPEDAQLIEQAGIEVETQNANYQVIPDVNLKPGDCRVKTSHGTIDATIEQQLQRIADELCH